MSANRIQLLGLVTSSWRETVNQAKGMFMSEGDSRGFSNDYGINPSDHPTDLVEFTWSPFASSADLCSSYG